MEPTEDALLSLIPPVAVSFFALFCRFECALKREGYLSNDRLAGPDWERIANELGQEFFAEVRASGNCGALIERPPKRQIAVNGRLEWETVAAVTNIQELFGALRRVRNNLFHGGKFSNGLIAGTERDQRLLQEACWLLRRAASADSRIGKYFLNPLL